MKKLILITLSLILLVACAVGWFNYRTRTDRFFAQYHETRILTGEGSSMEPTFSSGEDTVTAYRIDPIPGDVVVFTCSKPECSKNKSGMSRFTKRLIDIRSDGAWYVLGDNREVSFDSGDYGWLLPSEISDVWVVKLH